MNLAAAGNVYRTNKVLRNTFLLTGLSMIPTALGAWLSMALGVTTAMAASPWMTLLFMVVGMFGLMFLVKMLEDTALGVPAFFAFTGFCGVVISVSLEHYLSMQNGVQTVFLAGGMTAAICFVMSIWAMTTKKSFTWMGPMLFAGLLALLVALVLNLFLQLPGFQLVLAIIGAIIFSLYILYDVNQIVEGGETNYISASLNMYLNLINLFLNLLQILSDDD